MKCKIDVHLLRHVSNDNLISFTNLTSYPRYFQLHVSAIPLFEISSDDQPQQSLALLLN